MTSAPLTFSWSAVDITLPPALPSPEVTTTMDSTVTAGGQQALECTVTVLVVPFLTVACTLQWVGPRNSELASGSRPSLTHTLDPVRTSDAGQYTCRATVDIPSLGVSISGQSSTALTVQSESPGHSGYLVCCYSYSQCLEDPNGWLWFPRVVVLLLLHNLQCLPKNRVLFMDL